MRTIENALSKRESEIEKEIKEIRELIAFIKKDDPSITDEERMVKDKNLNEYLASFGSSLPFLNVN